MINSEVLAALQTCGALAVFCIFWQFFWKKYALERFRQDVFNIRDDMFLAIAQKKSPIGFDSEEYEICRRDLNSIIRCAHTVNLTGLLSMLIAQKILAPGFSIDDFEHSGSVIHQSDDKRIKEFVQPFQNRLNEAALRFLLTGSLGFMWCALIALIVFSAVALLLEIRDLVLKAFELRALTNFPAKIFGSVSEEVRFVQQTIVQLILLSEARGNVYSSRLT
jgi:hypothetical protein